MSIFEEDSTNGEFVGDVWRVWLRYAKDAERAAHYGYELIPERSGDSGRLIKSDYWCWKGKGELKGGVQGFVHAFPEILRQFRQYAQTAAQRRERKARG